MSEILLSYLITFGWAVVGSISMGVGIIITLKMFDISTRNVDEWQLIKEGNLPMGMIFSAIVIALGYVVGSIISP